MAVTLRGGSPLGSAVALTATTIGVGAACGAVAAFAGPVYAVAGATAAVGGALMVANARVTGLIFIATVTLLPFAVIPVPIGGVRLTLIDLTLSILLLTWLLRYLAGREGRFVTTPADGPLLVFIGIAIAAFVLGTAHAMTAESTRQFLKLINSLLFFFTVTQMVRTREDLERVLKLLIAGGAVAAAIGIALYHLPASTSSSILRSLRPFGYPTGDVLRYIEDSGVRTTTLRAIGTSVDPNVFGALLLITGTLAVGLFFAARGPARGWLALSSAVIGYALLLTLSRGSWLGFALGVGILTLVRYRRALLGLPALALPALVLFWSQVERLGEHLLKAVFAQDQATGMRLGEYKDAVNLIQQYPWLGVGFGSAPSGDLYLGVSSVYLLVAEEMGLTGLVAYLVVIATIVVVAARAYRRAPESVRPTALACLAAFAGVVLAAAFDHHYFNLRYQHMSALYWGLAALVLLSARLEPADNGP